MRSYYSTPGGQRTRYPDQGGFETIGPYDPYAGNRTPSAPDPLDVLLGGPQAARSYNTVVGDGGGNPAAGPGGTGTGSGANGNNNGGGAPAPTGGGSPGGGQDPYSIDYSKDPILQRINALADMELGDAQTGATATRKEIAIQYGDPTLAGSVLPGDQATADLAAGNPFSILKQLSDARGKRGVALDEGLNKSNLFYSGFRGQQLGNEATLYQQKLAEAQGAVQGQLGQVVAALLKAQRADEEKKLAAEEAAYLRALQNAAANPGTGSTGTGGGTTSTTSGGTGTEPTGTGPTDSGAPGDVPPPNPLPGQISSLGLTPEEIAAIIAAGGRIGPGGNVVS